MASRSGGSKVLLERRVLLWKQKCYMRRGGKVLERRSR